ncbi:NUDIX hydrolase domain protein [Oopsacas minuta]|uniref:NUDIX hydrolase domain protein n=1 Tax=Oopsacas minuta TaxID=111878 RepID=A0AAV7JB03_9METZ|nr:NUDIX hydrolase domain protein [Oopsacas minuta]
MATKSGSKSPVPQLATCHVVICWPDDKLREVSLSLASYKQLECSIVSEGEGMIELERLVDRLKRNPESDLLLLLLIGPCGRERYTKMVPFLSKRIKLLSDTFVCLLDTYLSESAYKRLELADVGVNMVTSSVEQSERCVKQVLSYLLTRHQSSSTLTCPECGLARLGEDDLWNHFPLYHINCPVKKVFCPICSNEVKNAGQHIHETHGPVVRKAALLSPLITETFYGFSLVIVQREKCNKFLCVQEFGQLGYWLPGGRVDPLERFQSAAIREVKEEVGIDIRLKGILSIKHGRYHGGGMRMEVVFYARPNPSHTEQLPKTTPDYESAGACWVTYDDLNHRRIVVLMACADTDVTHTVTKEMCVQSRIREDREASELLIALFLSACRSFKYHSLVRPCPPDYAEMSSSLHQSTVSQGRQREVVSLFVYFHFI